MTRTLKFLPLLLLIIPILLSPVFGQTTHNRIGVYDFEQSLAYPSCDDESAGMTHVEAYESGAVKVSFSYPKTINETCAWYYENYTFNDTMMKVTLTQGNQSCVFSDWSIVVDNTDTTPPSITSLLIQNCSLNLHQGQTFGFKLESGYINDWYDYTYWSNYPNEVMR